VLFVCENNFFAQSTSQTQTLAGDIGARAAALGIETVHANTWDWQALFGHMAAAVERVSATSQPVLVRVDTFRLVAHSKGKDNRPADYVREFWERDPLVLLEKALGHTSFWADALAGIDARLTAAVEAAKAAPFASPTSPYAAERGWGCRDPVDDPRVSA
jgi:2-oxoisovalerate dehydrogenase E1 component